MFLSIRFILLGFGMKCLLASALLLHQGNHVRRSFVGMFNFSLTLLDTFLTFCLTALYLQVDCRVLGLRLTRYHVCLLVQIVGEIYSSLQWPVTILGGLDHCWTFPKRLKCPRVRVQRIVYTFLTGVLWTLGSIYVFLVSGFSPVLEDEFPDQMQRCHILSTSQPPRIAMGLFLVVGCITLYLFNTRVHTVKCRSPGQDLLVRTIPEGMSDCHVRRNTHPALWIYFRTLASFLLLLALSLLLPTGIPAYLGLNTPWLCFINSVWLELVEYTHFLDPQPVRSLSAIS